MLATPTATPTPPLPSSPLRFRPHPSAEEVSKVRERTLVQLKKQMESLDPGRTQSQLCWEWGWLRSWSWRQEWAFSGDSVFLCGRSTVRPSFC